MAFSDFTYPEVLKEFKLHFATESELFRDVAPVAPGAGLALSLPSAVRLASAISTEKARSEWMIAPILADFWDRYHGQIGVYSGVNFLADPEAKLAGFVDFLISRGPQQPQIAPPVVVIVEAKNENIAAGLGQCIAGMVGAQRFNRREGAATDPIYGCSTTGTVWKFLTLSGSKVTLDLTEYTIQQADKLLGILTHMVGPPPVH